MGNLAIQEKGKRLACAPNTPKTDEIVVPILLQNKREWALVDTGANKSFLSPALAEDLGISVITDNKKKIQLASNNSVTQSVGTTENVQLNYMGKTIHHPFVVMDLAFRHPCQIGTDLMPKLGIAITGLASSWDTQDEKSPETDIPNDVPEPNNSPAGTQQERENFIRAVQPSLDANAKIPSNSFCTVPESIIHIDTPEGVTSYRRQYPLPVVSETKIQEVVDTWLKDKTIELAPTDTAWNSPLTLAPKKDMFGNFTDKRPCLDPRHINKLLKEDRFPLPIIGDMFHKFGGLKVFTTLDLKAAFHRFEMYETGST